MADMLLTGQNFQWFTHRLVEGVNWTDVLAAGALRWVPINNSIAMSKDLADPRYGAGGGTNMTTAALSGGNWAAGGITLTSVSVATIGSPLVTDLAAADQQVDVNAGNPSGIYHFLMYHDLSPIKPCMGYWSVPTPPLDLSVGNNQNFVFSVGIGV